MRWGVMQYMWRSYGVECGKVYCMLYSCVWCVSMKHVTCVDMCLCVRVVAYMEDLEC